MSSTLILKSQVGCAKQSLHTNDFAPGEHVASLLCPPYPLINWYLNKFFYLLPTCRGLPDVVADFIPTLSPLPRAARGSQYKDLMIRCYIINKKNELGLQKIVAQYLEHNVNHLKTIPLALSLLLCQECTLICIGH